MRLTLKRTLAVRLAELLHWAGATLPARSGANHLSIATFHRVLSEPERRAYPYPKLAVTPQELDVVLTYLTKHFDCGPLRTQHERFSTEARTERPLLALTFDDAPFDNFQNARPLLAKHGVKASFFAPVVAVAREELLWPDQLGFALAPLLQKPDASYRRLSSILREAGVSIELGQISSEDLVEQAKRLRPETRAQLLGALTQESNIPSLTTRFARPMTFAELRTLAMEGHEIGSHSMTHCLMPECDDNALRYEIEESRSVLQAEIAGPVDSFCYPNGDHDERTSNAVVEAGYARAVTTLWGDNGRRHDRFRLRRFDIVAQHSSDSQGRFAPALLAFRMSRLYAPRQKATARNTH